MHLPDGGAGDLPDTATWPTEVVARIYGASTWSLYDLVRSGGGIELADGTVIRPHRVGRSIKWPAAPIRRALGLDQAPTGPTPERPAAQTEQPPESYISGPRAVS